MAETPNAEMLRGLERMQIDLRQRLPRYVFRALAAGLYEEGRGFLKQWRAEMPGKFKTGGRRVATNFKLYTTGRDLDTLEMGVFTRWEAAPLYEAGGKITPSKGRFLMFAITPRAYTARGRVRRDYRDPHDPSKWNPAKLEGLFRLPTRRPGVYLLAREVTGTASGRGLGYRTRQGASYGVEGQALNRSRVAIEPAFILIRSTRREAVLDFFSGFERWAGVGGQRLQRDIGRALRAFARTEVQGGQP